MKKIVVPVDFSDYSTQAVEYAKKAAEAFDAHVTLVYVLQDKPKLYYFGGLDEISMNGMIEAEREHALEKLNEYKKSFAGTKNGAEILILEGEPAEAIIDYVEENVVDLVVMGSQGIGSPLSRIFLGSVASRVLHHIKVPTLLVR